MRARYENDAHRGQGYGLLCLEEAEGDAAGAQYSLVRSGDQYFLHPEGWQESVASLQPDFIRQEGSRVVLGISPTIVNMLDELNIYRILYTPPSGPVQKAVLELRSILYASSGGSTRLEQEPPTASPLSAPHSGGNETPDVPEEQPQERFMAAFPGVAEEGLTLPEPGQAFVQQQAGKKKNVLLAVAGLLALVVIGGAFWLFQNNFVESSSLPFVQEAAQDEPAPSSAPVLPVEPEVIPEPAGTAEPKVTQEPVTPLSPLDQARLFFRKSDSPDEALALSRTMPESSEGRDAAFLLLEMAAENGNAEAMKELGFFYDPSLAMARGSIVPDAEQAWIWYGKAAAGGIAGAGEWQVDLRAWLEAEAAKGSAEAQDILRRVQ